MVHLSDHLAAFLHINFSRRKRQPPILHFNSALLKKDGTKDLLTQAWATSIQDNSDKSKSDEVALALKALMDTNIRITRQEKKAGRAVYQSQFSEVRAAEAILAQDWHDLDASDKLNVAQQNLEEVRMDKFERQKNRSGALWARIGDKCTKKILRIP